LAWKGEAVGPNPTDRGKNGTKRSILVDGEGVPLGAAIDGANRHDSKLLEQTLDSIVVGRPPFDYKAGAQENLCLDNGYCGEPCLDVAVLHGYIPHVVPRGEERKSKREIPGYKARRWVVERIFSWVNRFRKILVRFEKYNYTYMGLLQFACAFVAFRHALVI
jgi:transposase